MRRIEFAFKDFKFLDMVCLRYVWMTNAEFSSVIVVRPPRDWE